jgi:hypothetical protein
MTLEQLKSDVQALFPVKFEESLIYEDDTNDIDKIIAFAIKKALSKYEKTESAEITGGGVIARAATVVQCVPSIEIGSSIYNVFNIMFNSSVMFGSRVRIKWRFDPSSKMLYISPNGASVHVTYLLESTLLSVLDLDDTYAQWAISYANALLQLKEGMKGIGSLPNVLPFEFNYNAMKEFGESNKKELEDELDEMYQGTFSIRVAGNDIFTNYSMGLNS